MRENLKKARKKAGMTQQQVADYLEISIVYYQKIEAGDRTGDLCFCIQMKNNAMKCMEKDH